MGSVWPKERLVTFWERSGPLSVYKNNIEFSEKFSDRGFHSMAALQFMYLGIHGSNKKQNNNNKKKQKKQKQKNTT